MRVSLDMVAGDVARRLDSIDDRVPEELRQAMRDACLGEGMAQRALLAPAAARLCGAEPADAMPVAAAVALLSGAVGCHLGLEGMPLAGAAAGEVRRRHGPVLAILAGDALVPMAAGVLAAECGRHSVMLVNAASVAMGATGVLGSLSLMVRQSGSEEAPPEVESDQGHMGLSPLARLAAWGGALMAGAPKEMADDCALAGLHTGRALDLLESDGPGPDQVFEARSELDRARELVGTGSRADIFSAVIDAVGRHFPSRSDELFFRS
jgi:hypothetical protein